MRKNRLIHVLTGGLVLALCWTNAAMLVAAGQANAGYLGPGPEAALSATRGALRICLDRGVDLNAFNTTGQMAMHVAAGRGLDAVVASDLSQEPGATRSIWDGVYTEQQANRGEREYGRSCEHCHGPGLEGDAAREIPPLVSDPFMRGWRGKNLKELFDRLSRSMPADNRGSLSARTYTDLIAYLLRVNDVPAGTSALPEPAGLEAISIGVRPLDRN